MIYVNNRADVYLPSPTGKADVRIPAGTSVARPSSEPWLNGTGLARSYVGVPISVAPADPAIVDLGAVVVVNGYTADATDHTNQDATGVVTASTNYSVFGTVTWTDGNGTWTADFSVTGDGTHGSGATFVVESISGAATKPIAAGSILTAGQGKLSLQFNAGAPSSLVDFLVFFEPIFVSPSAFFTETSENLAAAPAMITKLTLVQSGDSGANYVSGSEGSVKTVRELPVGSRLGDSCKLTTMKYQDATYPTKATSITVTNSTVVAGDLT